MLTIVEFAEKVKERVDKRIKATGGKEETSIIPCYSNNAYSLALKIHEEGRNIKLHINLEKPYFLYLFNVRPDHEKEKMDQVIEYIWNVYLGFCRTRNDREDKLGEIFKDYLYFDRIKDKIMYRLVNQKLNLERLTNIPHRIIEDLAITYFISLDEYGEDNGSIPIENRILDSWEVAEEDLYKYAKRNTVKRRPLSIVFMDDLVKKYGIRDYTGMYILSNKTGVEGAIAMFYPDVLKNLSEKLDDDLIIIPSSIHEVIVVPMSKNMDADSTANLIGEVNTECVDYGEILSDHPYAYYRKSNSVKSY